MARYEITYTVAMVFDLPTREDVFEAGRAAMEKYISDSGFAQTPVHGDVEYWWDGIVCLDELYKEET